jgi:hypothetical protein
VSWTGGYFNPPALAPISSWTIQFYANNAGQPGALLQSSTIAGTANETSIGTYGGSPIYTYSGTIAGFLANGGTQYWLAVYPSVGFPPQWGWATATGGDGVVYQDFFGARSQLGADMAFTLEGVAGVPEPVSVSLIGSGLIAFALLRRKRA